MKSLCWLARLLSIIFLVFITIFSLDVFSEGLLFPELLYATLWHLIPSFLIFFAILIAWNNEKWGGVAFVILSIASVILLRTYNDAFGIFLISLPPLVIGVLFLWNSVIMRRKACN